MRILLADDQPSVRSALKLILEQNPEMHVIGETDNIEDLVGRIGNDSPDIVLLDWELPGTSRKELIPRIREICPDLVIITLSSLPEAYQATLNAGADDFISKKNANVFFGAGIRFGDDDVKYLIPSLGGASFIQQ